MLRYHAIFSLASVGFVVGTVGGCSGAAGTDEHVTETTQADTSQCASELDPLAAFSGDPNLVTCNGPWEYEDHQDACTVTVSDNRCQPVGWEQTTCPYACNRYLGRPAGNQTRTYSVNGTKRTRRIIVIDHGTRVPETVFDHYEYPLSACLPAQGSALADVQRTIPVDANDANGRAAVNAMSVNGNTTPAMDQTWSRNEAETTRTCTVTVSGIPAIEATQCSQACNDLTRPNRFATCAAASRSFVECPSTGVKRTSAMGLTFPALKGQDPKLFGAPALSCLTAETTSDPSAKFSLLFDSYGRFSTGDLAGLPGAASVVSRLVRSLKLLVEMHGSALTLRQREAAIGLYTQPVWPACTADSPLDALPTTLTCTAAADGGVQGANAPRMPIRFPPSQPPTKAQLDGVLTFCERLALNHVPVSEAAIELPRCLSVGADLQSRASAGCDVAAYGVSFAKALGKLTSKANSAPLTETDPALRAAEIQARLTRIQDLYNASTPLFVGHPKDLAPYMSDATSGFWHGLYAPIRSGIDLQSPLAPQTFASASDAMQREVVLAAFPAPASGVAAPLTGAPLLYVLGDALQPLVAKLDDVGLLHDVACRFAGCADGPSGVTAVSATWAALAHLDDALVLKSLTAPQAPELSSTWKSALSNVALNHVILEQAVQDAYGDPSATPARLATDATRDIPAPAAGLAQTILKARQRTAGYEQTHLFDPGSVDALVTGLQRAKQVAAVADVKSHVVTLNQHRTDYEGHRARAISDAVQELGTLGAQNRATTSLRLKGQEMAEASSRLEGYRLNAALDAASFADFSKQFQRMLDDDKESADLKIARPTVVVPTIQQSNARYTPNGSRTVADTAVTFGASPWMLSAAAGDVLNIEVPGTWSPACALASTAPWQGHVDAAGIRVGPEGFVMQQQGSSFTASSTGATIDGSVRASASVSDRLCAGVRAVVGTTLPAGGVEAYASAEECVSHEVTASVTASLATTDTLGTEMRQALTFGSGVRLANTPFPELPAGSLVLVGVTPQSGGRTLASLQMVRVLQGPRVTIPVGAALDFYLVVNDAGTCGGTLSTSGGGLNLTISQLQPAGARGAALGRAMATTLGTLRARAASLALQGEFLPDEGTALRSQAIESLRSGCACEPTSYPAHYLGFYNAWIDNEILRLQRQVAIRKEMFALAQLAIEIKGYADDLGTATAQGRLLELLPTWALQNLDGEKLRADIGQIAKDLGYEVYPAARLRYPAALTAIRNDPSLQSQLRDLLNNATSKSLDELASQLELVAGSITTVLDNAVRLAPDETQTTLRAGISFVRPALYHRDALGVSRADDPTLSGYTAASEARSRAVWSAASAGKMVQFVVTPTDLFGKGNTQLPCVVATPVINWTGVYLGGVDETLADSFRSRPLNAVVQADEMGQYASVDGLFPYRMDNPDLRTGPIKISAGVGSKASGDFANAPHALAGLSPFTTIRVDFSQVQATPERPLDQANEIILVFELDAVAAAAGPKGVLSCGATP